MKTAKKTAVVGVQYGDEGKAKVLSYMLGDMKYGVVARFNGGGNAGHTMVDAEGNIVATHQVPSGIIFPGIKNYMLNGVLIDPVKLSREIVALRKRGYAVSPENLGISGLAHVTLFYHLELEAWQERLRGNEKIGTTGSGIGPTAVDLYGRKGMRFAEFLNPSSYGKLVGEKFGEFDKQELTQPGMGPAVISTRCRLKDTAIDEGKYNETDEAGYNELYRDAQEFLRPFLVDESVAMDAHRGKDWLYEGAQGVMLDPAYGSYPFVTSTHGGKAPPDTDFILGVAKAYITRVGGGPLVTRMDEETERAIRGEKGTVGAEFGTTTGRPRSCGWFDAPLARYAARVAGVDEISLTKLDVLSRVPRISVCTHYYLDGKNIASPPADRFAFARCKPVYVDFDSWKEDISGVRSFDRLPVAARNYVHVLEDMLGCEIRRIGVGPAADQMIVRT